MITESSPPSYVTIRGQRFESKTKEYIALFIHPWRRYKVIFKICHYMFSSQQSRTSAGRLTNGSQPGISKGASDTGISMPTNRRLALGRKQATLTSYTAELTLCYVEHLFDLYIVACERLPELFYALSLLTACRPKAGAYFGLLEVSNCCTSYIIRETPWSPGNGAETWLLSAGLLKSLLRSLDNHVLRYFKQTGHMAQSFYLNS